MEYSLKLEITKFVNSPNSIPEYLEPINWADL